MAKSVTLNDTGTTMPGSPSRTVDLVAVGKATAPSLRADAGLTTPVTDPAALRNLAGLLDGHPPTRAPRSA